MIRTVRSLIILINLFLVALAEGSPNQLGQTGLINAADSRIEEEGVWRIGYSRLKPYSALWSSVSLLSRLELSARYTQIHGVTAFAQSDTNYGDYKDKAFDAKALLWRESKYLPQVTFGAQDFLGTKLFSSEYLVLGKRLGEWDISLGYGRRRIDGVFGGVQYYPAWAKDWSLIWEYDAIRYASDKAALQSGADKREKHPALGLTCQWGWLGAQLAYQAGYFGLNAHLDIPLMQYQFIQKLDEPKPYAAKPLRSSLAQWRESQKPAQALFQALRQQGYKNIRLHLQQNQLQIAVSSPRISLVGRAVGRVARTALAMAPQGLESIIIHYYTLTDLPVVSYEFKDLAQLDRFFLGQVTYGELLKSMVVSYVSPADVRDLEHHDSQELVVGQTEGDSLKLVKNRDGQWFTLRHSDEQLSQFIFSPLQIGVFFNDPSGAVKYDWFALAKYQKQLGSRLFFKTSARATVLENVSDVTRESNSLLPHVRSDVAEYKKQRGVKLDSLLLNKYWQPATRVYARTSVGIYEEMFAGAGGQLLYLPREQDWAVDIQSDWLRQRDTRGGFGFRDYETVSSLLNLHYRFPSQGITLTARAGQFLAKDRGVRMEFARRFRSGFQIGAWYTKTNGNDITGPGSPGHPYYDKGIFIQIPLNTMLTKDTRAAPLASLQAWTRDVGQIVVSPGDLYRRMENVMQFDRPGYHLLSGFHE